MDSFVLFSILSIVLSVVLAWQIRSRFDKERKYTCFVRLMLAIPAWSVFALLEAVSDPKYKVLFSQLSYFGIVSVPVLWLLFSLEYAKKFESVKNQHILLLWIIPAITLAVVATNDLHGLFWTHIYPFETHGNIVILKYERGIWFIVNSAYSYLMFLSGLIIIFVSLLRSKVLKDFFVIIPGVLAPFASNILYLTRIVQLDYAPAALSFTCFCFAWAIVSGFFERKMAIAETIHKNMEEGIIFIDDEFKVISINPYAQQIIGADDFHGEADASGVVYFWDELKIKLRENANEYFEVFGNLKNAHCCYGIHVYSISKESGISGWIVSLIDITGKKQVEKELEERRIAAEAASIAKSNFLASMSHEIRTPLNGITGFTDILSHTPLSKEQRDYLGEIRNASDALLHMVNNVLDFSKIEADKMEIESIHFPLHTVVKDAVALFMPKAYGNSVELHSEIKPDVPCMVLGDPGRLRQVLYNLLGNAVKFTHEGEIVLTVDKEEETDQQVTIKFRVSDTGIGMSPEVQNKIFKPFTQADGSTTRKYGGTGLGLSISKRIIELMGGAIHVESREGEGTTFTFTLCFVKVKSDEEIAHITEGKPPAAAIDDGATDKRLHRGYLEKGGYPVAEVGNMRVREDYSRRTWKVLLVEDMEANRKLALIMLRKMGCDCDVALQGQEAVELCEKKKFDLIFMDCQMPVMDGYDATKHIKGGGGLNTETPVIAMTANALEGDREKCLAAGMDDFITKPINIRKLEEVAAKWICDAGMNSEAVTGGVG